MSDGTQLVRYDAMCQAIAQAYEVKDMAMTPEAVRAALEAGEAAWWHSHRGTSVADAIAAFLRALPAGNGYSPHDLADAVDAASNG